MELMQINNGQPLSSLMKSLKQERLLKFNRLCLEDLSKISRFLNAVWGQLYGKMGSPVFHQDYLQWLYGGVNKDKNILLGAFLNDELVAYQSFLYRRMIYDRTTLETYLNTHLAVSPQLDLRYRMDSIMQLSEQAHLFHPDSDYHNPDCSATFAFIEEGKPLKHIGDKLSARYFQVQRKTFTSFNQCVIMPARLKKYVKENPHVNQEGKIRPAEEGDAEQLSQLFNQIPDGPHFNLNMTEEEIKHYCFGHSAHSTFVIEQEGEIKAFTNFYPLEMTKEGKTQFYIIIDFLITSRDKECSKPHIAALLHEAVKRAEEIDAKAVVFENATYLNFETYVPLGLVPSFRKMNLVVLAKDNTMNYSGSFRCDIK